MEHLARRRKGFGFYSKCSKEELEASEEVIGSDLNFRNIILTAAMD